MKEANRTPDPFSFYKQCSKEAEDGWAKLLQETLATDFFAATMGKQLEGYANSFDMFKKNTKTYFETLPLPTEQDIHRLAGQIVALEDKIDFLEEGINDIQKKLETVLTYLTELSKTHEKPSKPERKKKTDTPGQNRGHNITDVGSKLSRYYGKFQTRNRKEFTEVGSLK